MDCSTSDAAEMTIYEKLQQICSLLGSSDYGRQYVIFKLRYWTMTEPPLRLIGSISPLFARFFMEPIWPVLGCLTILKPFSRKEMWPGLLECKKPICSFWHLHLVSKFYQWRRAHSRFYPGFFAAIKFVPRQLWCLHSPRNSMLCDDSTEKKVFIFHCSFAKTALLCCDMP